MYKTEFYPLAGWFNHVAVVDGMVRIQKADRHVFFDTSEDLDNLIAVLEAVRRELLDREPQLGEADPF